MQGVDQAIESVRRRVGEGAARLYRDLATLLAEAAPDDVAALRGLVIDALCGDFDGFRAGSGAGDALARAIAAAPVSLAMRVLLQTVLAQHLAGVYTRDEDAATWVPILLRPRAPRRMRARPAIALGRATPAWQRPRRPLTPRLAEVYRHARSRILRRHRVTIRALALVTKRAPVDCGADLDRLVTMGMLVRLDGGHMELGDVE